MVCLLSFAGPRFDAELEPDHRYANYIIETFFNWAISGLFILVFSIQLTEYIKFTDVWIRLVDQWSQKRPLYQLSHNHCPTFKNFVCCFLFEWNEVKVSNVRNDATQVTSTAFISAFVLQNLACRVPPCNTNMLKTLVHCRNNFVTEKGTFQDCFASVISSLYYFPIQVSLQQTKFAQQHKYLAKEVQSIKYSLKFSQIQMVRFWQKWSH